MTLPLILLVVAALLVVELLYFRAASYFNITDQPNHRSSHVVPTIRGGGIIFPIAVLCCPLFFGGTCPYFLTGVFLISLISFMDDIKPVNPKFRLAVHLLSVALLFIQLGLFGFPWYFVAIAFVFTIGAINAINFMDGINGITGVYSLITLITLLLINYYSIQFNDTNLILMAILAVGVFNFFNFRKKAVCFAGDVGSVSIGFIIIYFIISLMIETQAIHFILLLLVYGLDVVSTFVFRLIRREQVTEPHRTHFYQFLSNEYGLSQLVVALLYGGVQIVINGLLFYFAADSLWLTLAVIFVSGIVFVKMRILFEGSRRLFSKL